MTKEFGIPNGDKIILDRKETLKILSSLEHIKGQLLKVLDKGGVVVVEENEVGITTYNKNSFKRGKRYGK